MTSGMYKVGFLVTLVGGTMFVLCASSWFNAWVGLELNMLSFIPLMVKDKDIMGVEAGIKYFLVQAVASITILAMVIYQEMTSLVKHSEGWINGDLTVCGIGLALAMKLGMAPLHFWFPSIMENLSWVNQAILLTWQKIAPLGLMSELSLGVQSLSSLIILSVGVGGVGGLIQTSLAKLMAYSSISHLGWLGGALLMGGNIWVTYFVIYASMTISVIWILNLEGCYQLPHLWNKSSIPSTTRMSLFVGFFSMGGLPPFLGFFPKLMVVSGLIQTENFLLVVVMILTTLITLYYYFRVVFVIFVFVSSSPKLEKAHELKRNPSVGQGLALLGLNLTGLMICMTVWS